MEFDAILEPYFDALEAPLIVKSTQLGDAQIPKDPATGEPFPDHHTRMAAADRLVDLHRPKFPQPEADQKPPEPPVNIIVKFIKTPAHSFPTPIKPSPHTEAAVSTVPKVTFLKSKC